MNWSGNNCPCDCPCHTSNNYTCGCMGRSCCSHAGQIWDTSQIHWQSEEEESGAEARIDKILSELPPDEAKKLLEILED